MRKSILISKILLLSIIILTSCESKVKKSEYLRLQKELSECKKQVEELQNTPSNRLLKVQEYISKEDFKNAKIELNLLIDKFGDTPEAKRGELLIQKIEQDEKIRKENEERKKTLGFKMLKEKSTVVIDNITLKFKSVKTSKQWTFDNDKYDYYKYRDAERGNIFVLANVSVTSKVKQSKIPLISVYKLINGQLKLYGTMKREYLYDYENSTDADFKYVSTVVFAQALEISKNTLDNTSIFVVVKNTNCSRYEYGYYLDASPDGCNIKSTLTIDDFDKEYSLIKILNREKL